MSKYIDIATEANRTAKQLLKLIPEAERRHASCLIARLVNCGLQCNAKSNKRLKLLEQTVKGLPVKIKIQERQSERLITKPI